MTTITCAGNKLQIECGRYYPGLGYAYGIGLWVWWRPRWQPLFWIFWLNDLGKWRRSE